MSTQKQEKESCLLPLRDLVVFPKNVSSLFVGREKSMSAVSKVMESDRMLVLTTQKDKDISLPNVDDLHSSGVLCEILQMLKMPDGTLKLLLEGVQRVFLERIWETANYYKVIYKLIEIPEITIENEISSLNKKTLEIINKFTEYNNAKRLLPENFLVNLYNKKDYIVLLDTIAHNLLLSVEIKQSLLSIKTLLAYADKLLEVLSIQLDVLSLDVDIQSKVKKKMDKHQKHFYLNEQLKVIKEELEEYSEVDKYRKTLEELSLSDEKTSKFESEITKLERIPNISSEYSILRNYLDCAFDLPWNTLSEDNLDLIQAESILDASHYGLDDVKERLLEFISIQTLCNFQKEKPSAQSTILCLLGPPGVGKTSLVRSLADALGRQFARISLGGIRDEAEIRGHRRTYVGALPGRIISSLQKVRTRNPVILLDEIDKMSEDFRGNPAAALLEVLDNELNKDFTDHYLEVSFDLSEVIFVATANALDKLLPPLLDRMEVISLSGYTEEEKLDISNNFLTQKLLVNHGVSYWKINYPEVVLLYLIRHYTKEAGVRNLERVFSKIFRKIVRELLLKYSEKELKKEISYNLTIKSINKILGPPRYDYGIRETENLIGMSNGLAWTSAGGEILFIEVVCSHGKGNVTVTGNLGAIMKESVETAMGYVRSINHLLAVNSDFFETTDFFIHAPEGAVPKDGPSAGVAIAVSLISAIKQVPVYNFIGMTGEITLRGKVLPIGGLKEKSLAAYRAGITNIICPQKNKKDLEKIPDSLKKTITFHFVDEMREVLEIALDARGQLLYLETEKLPFNAKHLTDISDIKIPLHN